jgi:hypothetical protein
MAGSLPDDEDPSFEVFAVISKSYNIQQRADEV